MSRRKKKIDHRARLQRQLEQRPSGPAPADAMLRPPGVSTPDLDRLEPQAQLAMLEAAEFLYESPEAAAELMSLSEDDVHFTVAGLAFPELLGEDSPTLERRLKIAAGVRVWHILHGWTSAYDWWPPIKEMTDRQILDQIAADVIAGHIIAPETRG